MGVAHRGGPQRECVNCGKMFEVPLLASGKEYSHRRTCGPACANELSGWAVHEAHRKARDEAPVAYGVWMARDHKEMARIAAERGHKDDCRCAFHNHRFKEYRRRCLYCRKRFTSHAPNALCCSNAHYHRYRRRLLAEATPSLPERRCLHCHTLYTPKMRWGKYCTTQCQAKASRLRREQRLTNAGELLDTLAGQA